MDQLVEDLLFLEVIIQKNELNPAPPGPVSGSGGSRLELGALGAACCAASVILAAFAHFLLCTLVQISSVLTWLFLGWVFVPVPAVGGAVQVLAGPGRQEVPGVITPGLKELPLPTGSSGDGAFLLLLSWKTILLYFSKAELTTQLLLRSFHTQTPFISEKL